MPLEIQTCRGTAVPPLRLCASVWDHLLRGRGNDESRTQRAAESGFRLMYGDAGIRTRVRLLIHRDVYVRIPPFCSPRPLIGRLEAPREPAVKVSPAPSRRQTRASPNLSTPGGPPQAGL